MAKSKYPRVIWRKVKSESVPTHKNCVVCGKKFLKDESVAMKETQYSWYRGDDIREALCMKCLPPRDKRRPEHLRLN